MGEVMCPHCGSKETVKNGESYQCKDCDRVFGRDHETDDGLNLEEVMTGLRFSYEQSEDRSIHMRFAEEENVPDVVYEFYTAENGKISKEADVISLKEWNELKHMLIYNLFVCDWDRQYFPVNDGSEPLIGQRWRLDLILQGEDQQISYRGDGVLPPYFRQLTALLKKYAKS